MENIGDKIDALFGRKELAMASMYKTKGTQHKVKSLLTDLTDGLMPSNGVLSSTSKTPSEVKSKGTTNFSEKQENSQKDG
jgi:hypothetical protein